MNNVYFPGDPVFLYATFQTGLNLIQPRNNETTNTRSSNNTKNGLYIDGNWVTFDDYMRYYSSYLIDPSTDSTYLIYNSYYSDSYYSGYNNWYSSFYTHALSDENIKDVIIEQISLSMQYRILHDEDGEIYEDIPWTDMKTLSSDSVSEFHNTFCIPYDFTPGQYQIIYKAVYKVKYYNQNTKQYYTDEELQELNFDRTNKSTTAYTIEHFYIAYKSDTYDTVVKVAGNVNYEKTTLPAEDVRVSIFEANEYGEETKVYQSLTDMEGYWEAYLYPNQYKFVFSHTGYQDNIIYDEIIDDNNDYPFATVSMMDGSTSRGSGVFRVFDVYTTKTGQPLNNLTVKAYSIFDPSTLLGEDVTNDEGMWELYLDDGWYLLRISGTSLGGEFNRVFRMKITHEGKWYFSNATGNMLTDQTSTLNRGNGRVLVKDTIIDKRSNPISEIQVNVFNLNTELLDENIIAQDYSDMNGEYTLFLDPGTYIFEYFHPNYTVITETKIIGENGSITTVEEEQTTSERAATDDNIKYYYTSNANSINYYNSANANLLMGTITL